MDWSGFEHWGQRISTWARRYHETLRDRPVRAQVAPGDMPRALPETPPDTGVATEAISAHCAPAVTPGITHRQHPRFLAHFPATAPPPSIHATHPPTSIAPP